MSGSSAAGWAGQDEVISGPSRPWPGRTVPMPGRPAPGVFGARAFGARAFGGKGFGAGAFGVAGLGPGAFGAVRTWVAADALRGPAAGAAGRAAGSRSESTRVP